MHGLCTTHISVQIKTPLQIKLLEFTEYMYCVLYDFQGQKIDTGMVFHFFTIHSELAKRHAVQNQIIHFDSCMCRIPQITFMFNYIH